jgi:hypothetical protein
VIGYRLLPPAEEEMTEAALFYEAARSGLGDVFLDDIQHAIDTVLTHPELGESVAYGFRRILRSCVVPSRSTGSSAVK